MKITHYCLVSFILIGFIIRLITLQYVTFLPPSNAQQEDAKLFHHLLQSKLLENMKDTGQLKLPKQDFELIEKAKRAQNPDLPDLSQNDIEQCEWVHALYHSAPGHFVHNQIRQWNQTRQLAGIRDNRPKPFGDRKNQWQLKNPFGSYQTIPFMSERFGYINHGELRPDFSNWLAVHPFKHDEVLTFHTLMHVTQTYHLIVHLIGSYPVKLSPQNSVSKIKPICDPHVSPKTKCSQSTAQAFEIHFNLKKGTYPIIIETKGIQNPHVNEPGMHIQRHAKTLAYYWSNVNRRTLIKTDAPLMIRTADGIPLTDSRGNPTEFTLENGLVPLIGMGKQTPFSLYGLLSRSQVPLKTDEVVISINSQIQTIAQTTLTRHVNQMCKLDKAHRKNKYCKKRKASVVILNANTGAILAVANYPVPPKHINPWDLITFDRFFSKNNPMTLQAWQGLGVHSAPGSSFKPVVVMTALDMQSYKKVDFMVQELSKISPLYNQSQTMIDFYTSYMPQPSETYWKENIFPCFKKPKDYKLTLSDAIMASNNEWHQRLAILMDGNTAFSYDSDYLHNANQSIDLPDLPEFNLCQMAKRLGFGSFIDLAPYLEINIRLKPDYNKNIEGDILFAHTGELALCHEGRSRMKELAKTAIGHGVSSTPLQMARIAASIATQRIVIPDLLSFDNHGLLAPKPRQRKLYLDHLDVLQNAMGKVVHHGHVKQVFSGYDGHTRVHGKTGTASMFEKNDDNKKDKYNTTWFIGWQAPKNETNDTIAFACMMTHAMHSGYRKGAEVSAPVIKDILKQIDW